MTRDPHKIAVAIYLCVIAIGSTSAHSNYYETQESIEDISIQWRRLDFPFMASIQQKPNASALWTNICGASLIHPKWVLTSAHCAVSTKLARTRIVLDAVDISASSQSPGVAMKIDKVVIHPEFNEEFGLNDIGLLKLHKSAETVRVANLIDARTSVRQGQQVLILGWGATSVGSTAGTSRLQNAVVHLKPASACERQWEGFDNATQLCIGDPEIQVNACNGDMGGPVLLGDGRTQIGIMTKVDLEDCTRKNTLGARVSAYRAFIKRAIGVDRLAAVAGNLNFAGLKLGSGA